MKTYLFLLFYSASIIVNAQNWVQVWGDEFDGTTIDFTKWGYDTGGNGFGNEELQYYTDRPENSYIENGNLVIKAIHEDYSGNEYTSAKLMTQYKGDWKYGRMEIRAKLPTGKGIWPAIWMLPTENTYGGWPKSGEIDIMENVGFEPNIIHWNVHTEDYNHSIGTNKGDKATFTDPSSNFYVYAIEWTEDKIDFFVDDTKYFTFNKEEDDAGKWPFDQPFFLILNVAVGGTWGGLEGIDNTVFPQEMQVDYVRVYEKSEIANQYTLTIPDAINGSTQTTTNAGLVTAGTEITLTAIPDEGYEFLGWKGTFDRAENPVSFSMDLNVEMTPRFKKIGELLTNPTFNEGLNGWWYNDGGKAEISNSNNNMVITTTALATNPWDVQVAQTGLFLKKDCNYSVNFSYSTSGATEFLIGLGLNYDPWSPYTNSKIITTGAETDQLELTANITEDEPNARVYLDLGDAALGSIIIHEISLTESCTVLDTKIKEKSLVEIFPNPGSNTIHFSTPLNASTLTFINSQGQKQKLKTDGETVDVSNLESGIYIVKINGESFHFIKE